MKNSSAASELPWEEQQCAERAQADLEHREWLKSFALVLALSVFTIAVAAVLASLGADGTTRL